MSIPQHSPQNITAGSFMSYFMRRSLQQTQSVNMQQITHTAHTVSGLKPPRNTAGISRAAMNTRRSRYSLRGSRLVMGVIMPVLSAEPSAGS